MSDRSPLEDQLWEALSRVNDPELGQSLVKLNMVKRVSVENGVSTIGIELTTPSCPLSATIREMVTNECIQIPEIHRVVVEWSARPKPENKSIVLPGVRRIVAVSSGKGGVGKSTVSAFLALALAKKGLSVGLMDTDAYGPNIPTILGMEGRKAEQDMTEKKILPMEIHGIRFMSVGLMLNPSEPVIWRGPMLDRMVKRFLSDVRWGELDVLIVDMPPGTGDVQLSLCNSTEVHGAVMVTTPQALAVHDVVKAIGMFRTLQIDILGIVENMSYFEAPQTGERHYIFGKDGGELLAQRLNLPFLGAIPLNPFVSELNILRSTQALAEVADRVWAELNQSPRYHLGILS